MCRGCSTNFGSRAGRRLSSRLGRKRSEPHFCLRIFYQIYKLVHLILTGVSVRVGNFSMVPRDALESLTVVSELWNHYAAAVFKSRSPYVMVPIARGKRLSGESRMNFTSLVIHGLSAISVFGDSVGVRLAGFAVALGAISLLGIATTVGIRLFTNLAIPGWATVSIGVFTIVLLQAIMLSTVFVFKVILNARQNATIIPDPRLQILYQFHFAEMSLDE